MTIDLPPLSSNAISFSLTSYFVDLERAQDLQTLDLHHGRLEGYLAALRDVEAIPREELQELLELFAKLYRRQFRYLGTRGAL